MARWQSFLLLLAGCGPVVSGPGQPSPDTGGSGLTITAITPDSGPATGGTEVTVRGEGFSAEAAVTVGGDPCETTTWISAYELVCVAPSGPPGEARLVVRQGEASASATWTWLEGDTDADTDADSDTDTDADTDTDTSVQPLDYCHLQYPCSLTASAGSTSEAVYVWVYESGVTTGSGQGAGIQVQLGVGAAGSTPDEAWTWVDMAYNVDKDGLSTGDLANDEYAGALTAPSAGGYDYCGRASADGGRTWTLCDRGGNACGGLGSDDGYSPADAGTLTVE